MARFWNVLNKVIEEADVIVEVLDSRSIDDTRNKEIEDKVRKKGKDIIFAMNKCDLVDKDILEKAKKDLGNAVFVSASEHQGTAKLKQAILKAGDFAKLINVGFVGYPNTGKSSIINAMAGRSKAKTSSESGFTRGIQKIKLSKQITLLDTPGVIPYKENDPRKHGSTGAVDFSKIKDPEDVFIDVFKGSSDLIMTHYKIFEENPELFLERVAEKFKYLKKGAVHDTTRAAKKVLMDWQKGIIRF